VSEARSALHKRPSWMSILVKAIGITSMRVPELRRAYMPYPWPHFYESPFSSAAIAMDRVYEGEHGTFVAPMPRPETTPLAKIHSRIHAWQTQPVEETAAFRRLIRISKLWMPIRRLLWGMGLYLIGKYRTQYFGTFSINSIAATRCRMLQFATPTTVVFYYGLATRGEMTLQIAFDHRVFDGYAAARTMSELESILNTEIVQELKQPPASELLAA
jgi:hypothetical protein